MVRKILAVVALMSLAACGGQRALHDLRAAGGGPDEFSVQPGAPLEIPENLSVLPVPTPGGSNLADATPNADAIAALGGRASALQAGGGIPASEAALVTQAGRFGVAIGIRAQLAEEDAAFRRRKSRGWFGGGYFRAYADTALDAYAELRRFRALGVQVPTAPPGG